MRRFNDLLLCDELHAVCVIVDSMNANLKCNDIHLRRCDINTDVKCDIGKNIMLLNLM